MRSVSVTACWYVLTSNSFSMPVCRYPMSGWHLTMVSPSNSSSRRSTPCVEGCCGPMFRDRLRGFALMASSATASGMVGVTVSLTFVPVSNPVARDAVILAQRMPFPIVRQHDAAQIRMVPEPHAEQIECFPLEPVRAAPHFRHGIDLHRRWASYREFAGFVPCQHRKYTFHARGERCSRISGKQGRS